MSHITKEQRYLIEAYLKSGKSKEFIAEELNVHRSTIYREIKRNKSKRGLYSASIANEISEDRKDRYTYNRKFDTNCKNFVEASLKQKWSPCQIVGYAKKNGIPIVSHERIYQHIRDDKLNGGKLYENCRHKLKHRKRPVGKHYPIANRVSIDDRPAVVDEKTRFGDWEMDTIIGANQQGAILTLTERKTNFIIIKKLPLGKDSIGVKNALIDALFPYKKSVLTITTDNGPEFAKHTEITDKLNIPIYFTHPYCSWEKGSIENVNKLIRQYINKSENLNNFSQKQLTDIQHKINNRPRKKLDFDNPKILFYKFVSGNVAFAS